MPCCFAPLCKSGNNGTKAHLFRPPENTGDDWKRIMQRLRSDDKFDPSNKLHKLCHLHFKEEEVIKFDTTIINGEEVKLPRIHWKLKSGSIPSNFPNIPNRLTPHQPTPRRILKRSVIAPNNSNKVTKRRKKSPPLEITEQNVEVLPWWNGIEILNFVTDTSSSNDVLTIYRLKFDDLDVKISYSLTVHKVNGGWKATKDSEDVTSVIRNLTGINIVSSIDCVKKIIQELLKITKCNGIAGYGAISHCPGAIKESLIWRSSLCNMFLHHSVCKNCTKLLPRLQQKFYKLKLKKNPKQMTQSNARRALTQYYKRKLIQTRSKLQAIRKDFKIIQKQLDSAPIKNVESFLKSFDIPESAKLGILQSVQSAKRHPKGRRYATNWLLECLLLKIKSPAAYHHLREAKILPLPHPNTLRGLILGQRCNFGFNEFSLEAIQREFQDKIRRDRQGVLVFDEIQLREGVEFNKATAHFTGYVDFGEYTDEILDKKEKTKLANHALVLMFRPLNSDWVQPIAVFATRNAASGNALEKVLFSAILKLEAIGAEVLCVTCDGAKPNRSLWKRIGITGYSQFVVNKILHPCDESRYLYFGSDVPHLFKCIRNHFLKYKKIKFQGKTVCFNFYERLLKQDKSGSAGLRKCPKLSASHTDPNPFEKMIVSLATQLFSRSVSTGLKFYRELGHSDFYGSEATEQFTLLMNDVFDCLNARYRKVGLRLSSPEFLLLKRFAVILEQELLTSKPSSAVLFASTETLAALRVTIATTIEMTEYLVNELQYAYVLTAKFNQDCLEKFFGLIRAAGGREDHPTVSSFLQLFRLLSLYNPTKRLLRGNVIDDGCKMLCEFNDKLRESAKQFKTGLVQKKLLREEVVMDKLVGMNHYRTHRSLRSSTSGRLESTKSESDQNLIYYLAGFVCFKAKKLINCDECVNSITSNVPVFADFSKLVYIMNKGPLTFASEAFYKVILLGVESNLSSVFQNMSSCGDIILECVRKMCNVDISSVGCDLPNHKYELLTTLIPYYITMRVHFYVRSLKSDIGRGKATKSKRKESKLVS